MNSFALSHIDPPLLKGLDDIDLQIIEFRLGDPAMMVKDIAEKIGVSRQTIHAHTTTPAFQAALEACQLRAIDIIMSAKERAAIRLVQLIDSPFDAVARQTCVDLLADILPAKRVDLGGNLNVHHFDHDLAREELFNRLKRLRNGHIEVEKN